jgi:hypothetical protein
MFKFRKPAQPVEFRSRDALAGPIRTVRSWPAPIRPYTLRRLMPSKLAASLMLNA